MKKYIIILFSLLYFFFIPSAEARQHLPAGGYLQSCNRCEMLGNVLSCQCESRRGHMRNTSLRVGPRCGEIENLNGNLHCKASGKSGHIDRDGDRRGRFDADAGPIWNQADAERKCPRVCRRQGGSWSGDWRSTRGSSICGCDSRRNRDDQGGFPFNVKF